MSRREARGGCSADWPARKLVADGVKTRWMERLECLERATSISGSLMVATEPVQARRRCALPSEAWADAWKGLSGGEVVGWEVEGTYVARPWFMGGGSCKPLGL